MTEYALVDNPHKNYYPQRLKPIQFIGLHVTAGLQDLDMLGIDHSATGTNNYGATTSTQASWHCCVDSDSIEYALPDNYCAWHIINYNSASLGLEICNADARWDNKPAAWVEATLRNAAKVCAEWATKYDIPLRLLSKAQIDAGLKGFTYHMFLDPTRRHDPGSTFPVEQFFKLVAEAQGKPNTPPKPAPPLPMPPKPAAKPNCTRLQAAIHLPADNQWGPNTDKSLEAVIDAASSKHFPYGVKFAQIAVGSKPDGMWGPNSQAATVETVKEIQRSLSVMGFSPGKVDGLWGRNSENAYENARTACHI